MMKFSILVITVAIILVLGRADREITSPDTGYIIIGLGNVQRG